MHHCIGGSLYQKFLLMDEAKFVGLAFQRPPLKHLKLQVGRNTFGKLYRLTTRADASMGFLPELSGGEKKTRNIQR